MSSRRPQAGASQADPDPSDPRTDPTDPTDLDADPSEPTDPDTDSTAHPTDLHTDPTDPSPNPAGLDDVTEGLSQVCFLPPCVHQNLLAQSPTGCPAMPV